jgi:tetratricopeptide (TPR) repeat protein
MQEEALNNPAGSQQNISGNHMEEAVNNPAGSQLHSTGDYVAIVQGAGNATVNVALPPLKQQWLKPARQSLSKAFVGRQQLVDDLIAELTGGKNVAITGRQAARALQGMGGIGKTYLALKLAGEVYDRFPGGVMRIDVGPQVSDEASAQLPLGRLAGYAFGGIAPQGPFQPEQVAAWLDAAAPGPFLVIFDDLWHAAPLRLLSRALPPQAVQIVTTRFTNVAQAIGASVVPLDRLSPGDGLALLEDRLRCQGDTTHRAALEAIVKLLGGHALALELAAAQIKKPSHIKVVLQALEQGIGQGKLDSLNLAPGEDRDENLERSFALGYERMIPTQQRLLRALGVFAEESMITAEAAAAIWGIDDTNAAQRALFELTDLALLSELEDTSTGTTSESAYRQHGLLRIYARALMEQEHELIDASRAHAQYYTDKGWQAITSSPRDNEFLDQHLPNLLAALQWSENNEPSLFTSLLDAISEFLLNTGQSALLETLLPKAVAAAHQSGNTITETNLLKRLGDLELLLGNLEQARAHYDAALPLYRAERARLGEANTLRSLGDLERRLGHLDEARSHYEAALPLYRAERNRLGEANTLRSLGDLERRLGHLDEARSHYEAALPLYRAERARLGEANTLMGLGDLENDLGNPDQARTHYHTALPLFRALRDRLGEASIYRRIGDIFIAQKEWSEARVYYEQALPLFTIERELTGQANSLIGLGRARFELGDHEQGMKDEQQAAELYRRIQRPDWAKRAEQYLAEMRARLKQQ